MKRNKYTVEEIRNRIYDWLLYENEPDKDPEHMKNWDDISRSCSYSILFAEDEDDSDVLTVKWPLLAHPADCPGVVHPIDFDLFFMEDDGLLRIKPSCPHGPHDDVKSAGTQATAGST